jgi:UDP-N-acetylglucosamine:LPS N-acetylglucosamine transferase
MKILFINGTNNIGGGELSLLSIVKKFKNNSSVVSFDYGDYTNLLEKNHINSIVLKNSKELLNIKRENGMFGLLFKIKYLLLTIIELRKLIKEYDIIYLNSQKAILLGLFSALFINKKIVIHVRDMMDNPNISNIQKNIFKYLVNIKKPIIIADSIATKKALTDIGINVKIEVIYNGCLLYTSPSPRD